MRKHACASIASMDASRGRPFWAYSCRTCVTGGAPAAAYAARTIHAEDVYMHDHLRINSDILLDFKRYPPQRETTFFSVKKQENYRDLAHGASRCMLSLLHVWGVRRPCCHYSNGRAGCCSREIRKPDWRKFTHLYVEYVGMRT